HVHQSNVGMSKTMELLLGVPPLSQFDRYATDMRDYFTSTPDLTPYDALPRTFPPETFQNSSSNVYLSRAADISKDLNFDLYDSAGSQLSQVIELMHVGQLMEDQKSSVDLWIALGFGLLLGAGALKQALTRTPSAD